MATRIEDQTGSRIVGSHVPLNVALAVIPQLSRPLLALVIDRAIEHLDGLAGDPDLEDDDPAEDADASEDDDPDTGVEDSPLGFDPEEDMCLAGDDRVCSGPAMGGGGYEAQLGPGDADDAEREQMLDDVPCLPVFAIEPDPATGERKYLGLSNLSPAFVSGRREREA